MGNRFVFGVANAYGYDAEDNIMFSSKTLLDSSIAASISNVEVRGGWGNPLLATYYHSPGLTLTLNDTQWNLNFLAKNVGGTVVTGKNVYAEETVTLGAAGAGTILGTPLAAQGSTIYGWVSLTNGIDERVEFTGQSFSCSGSENDVVTVRYYHLDSAAKSATISSNFVPAIARLVLEAQLFGDEQGSSRLGLIQFEFPKVTLSGQFQVQLKADGVSTTPLEAKVLAYTPSGTTQSIYGYFSEVTESANWYDDCIALAIIGGNQAIATTLGTLALQVRGIHSDGTVSQPPVADLSFTSGTIGVATVGLHTGVVQGVAAGTTLITVAITSKNTVEAQATITVPA